MSEVTVLVENKIVQYSGLFRMDELYTILRKFLQQRGYFIIETRTQEDVLEQGKQVIVRLEPQRRFNDYAQGKLRIVVTCKGLKDKVVKMDGQQQKYQQGDVQIQFWAFLEADRRSQWEGSGWHFLFRTISNKFIRRDYIHNMMDLTVKDVNELSDECKSYLNMSRFKIQSTLRTTGEQAPTQQIEKKR